MKIIAAEEEWLRLLVHELTPVIQHLHADELPLSELLPSAIARSPSPLQDKPASCAIHSFAMLHHILTVVTVILLFVFCPEYPNPVKSHLSRIQYARACQTQDIVWPPDGSQYLGAFHLVRHDVDVAADAMRALERVADKALQLGEAALCSYRSHSSSQCKNAALLHYAVRLHYGLFFCTTATWSLG